MSRLVCVTGATGFLGRRFINSLLEHEEIRVRCIVRPTSDVDACMEAIPVDQRSRVECVRGELADAVFLQDQLANAEVVYHLAAALGGGTSTMFLNTVIPTRTLMAESITAGVKRFVLVSSLGVYGTDALRAGATLDESTPIDGHPEQRDPYTFSKVRQEQAAWDAYEQCGLPLVVVRPGVIYGEGRSVLTSRVGLSIGPLFIRMGGGQRLPYTYVENCADAIVLAGLKPGIEGNIYNVIDDELPTGSQLIKRSKRHGKRIRSVWIPRMAIAPMSSMYHWYSRFSSGQLPPVLTRYKSNAIWKSLRCSNQKAKQELDWSPRVSTEDGINRTLNAANN